MLDPKRNPARIVLVEDNPGDVLLLRRTLDQDEPYYIFEILLDGAEAIRFVREQWMTSEPEPCVIVLDWNLPKHDGKSVLQSIRTAPGMSHVRVVALTGMLTPRNEAEILRLGVRLCRMKPTDLDGWHRLAGEILEICREPTLSAVS
jgi:two-component system response regulator